MTNTAADRPSKKERQNAAREKARVMREEAKKKARRRRMFTQGGIGLGIVVILAVVAIVIVQVARPTSTAGPKNMLSDGILLTSTTQYVATGGVPNGGKPTPTKQSDDGKAHITLYEDLQCPICNEFETANDAQIAQWLNAGTATVEIHPISFLDSSSLGNRYSSRAASAIACVAEYSPQDFWAVNQAFYKNQPAENTNGKTDAQIISTIKQGGVSSSTISSCVKQERFKGWVQQSTSRAMSGKTPVPNSSIAKVTGTPTIIVNGQQYNADGSQSLTDPSAFLSFVQSTVKGWTPGSSSSTPSPTATPAG
ncbi:DsbA family protein [Gryllotalpicola reticulitermitis]|uniref:DsbA family protein n=1 Tax=Gryllotalpicola reticulitermitis TaxID=1184153 RepID=A0ABV8Q420_9MICO